MTSFAPPSRLTVAIAPMGRYEPLSCRSFDRNDDTVAAKIREVDCRIFNDRSWDNPVGDLGKPAIAEATVASVA